MRLNLTSAPTALKLWRQRACFMLLSVLTMNNACANHLPLWEVRAGVSAGHLPYYRGSDESHNFIFPFPYFIYRGERIRASDEGVKGFLYSSERVNIDISLAAGLPARSSENGPRAGMPPLNTTLELGPSLEINLWKNAEMKQAIWFVTPLRAAFSFDDFTPHHEGEVISPYLIWLAKSNSYRTSISAGPMFASANYHNYFYGVTPNYATASRSAYSADAGYSGTRITLGLTQQQHNAWFGVFVRYDRLDNAQFENSPLVQRKDYFAAGAVFTWRLFESRERAKHEEDALEPRQR